MEPTLPPNGSGQPFFLSLECLESSEPTVALRCGGLYKDFRGSLVVDWLEGINESSGVIETEDVGDAEYSRSGGAWS